MRNQFILRNFWMMAVLFICSVHATDGVPGWTNYYNRSTTLGKNSDQASSVAIDGSGNVFVTGSSQNASSVFPFTVTYDYATIKYSSSGEPLWTNRFNGSGNGNDYANSLVVDGSGNVYVTGYTEGLTTGNDFATFKYSNSGATLWTNFYNSAGNGDDQAIKIALDNRGNIYVTGQSSGDFATIKYSGAGVPLWTNRFHGSGYGNAYSLVVDGSGNAIVTGPSSNANGNYDYATIKYSDSGSALWTNFYNGAGNLDDIPYSLGVDSNGNVFVTGFTTLANGSTDYATVMYSSVGVPMWTNFFNGPIINSFDYATSLAVDNAGNIYVTGRYAVSLNGYNYGYATIKYSGSGIPLWTNTFARAVGGYNGANNVAVDISGNVYVTGMTYGTGTGYDYATIKYTGGGIPVWTNFFNGAGNSDDYVASLAVDSYGNVCVAGYTTGSGTGDDYVTIKYFGPTPLSFVTTNSSFGFWDQQFSFTLTGPVDSNAVISASTDLKTWIPLVTNSLTGGSFNFTDTVATNYTSRFYRAMLH